MERSGKKKKVEDSDDQDYKKKVLLDYSTPGVVGNLGSVSEYAKAQTISVGRAKRELEKNLAYTLHKPRRRRGAFQPVLVFDMDEQWVADLIEIQSIAKQNKGYRYLLTVIDVLSKYAWVQSLKKKTGKDLTEAFRLHCPGGIVSFLSSRRGRGPQIYSRGPSYPCRWMD